MAAASASCFYEGGESRRQEVLQAPMPVARTPEMTAVVMARMMRARALVVMMAAQIVPAEAGWDRRMLSAHYNQPG